MAKLRQTPSQTVGPYFAYGLAPEQYGYQQTLTSIAGSEMAQGDIEGQRIRVEGRVFDGAGNPISDALIDVLADLHDVDPSAVGLADFGRPEGFLERQLRRWTKQLDSSRSRDLPGIDELFATLASDIPHSGPPAIVHGDYRLDNVIVGADDRVAAVLDWEMATLGDPLTDLGLFIVYWDGMVNIPSSSLTTAVSPKVIAARVTTERAGRASGVASPAVTGHGKGILAASRWAP